MKIVLEQGTNNPVEDPCSRTRNKQFQTNMNPPSPTFRLKWRTIAIKIPISSQYIPVHFTYWVEFQLARASSTVQIQTIWCKTGLYSKWSPSSEIYVSSTIQTDIMHNLWQSVSFHGECDIFNWSWAEHTVLLVINSYLLSTIIFYTFVVFD